MVTRATRGQERGQALAELVLGLAVFVTVLIFGLHFAEISHLGLKTHEAMAAAAWDATGYRVERVGPTGSDPVAWYDTNRHAQPRTTTTTNDRYADWDGRQSVTGSAPVLAFTRANELVTTCNRNMNAGNVFRVDTTANAPAYGEPGALSCSTQGSASAINIPTSYLQNEDQGFFTERHVRRNTFPLCGLGRATNGQCLGTLSVLLGDHGLTSGESEELECAVLADDLPGMTCANRAFYRLTHEAWDRSMGWTGAPEQFADRVTGGAPTQRISGFYLSFRGEESVGFGEAHDRIWQTNPMDHNLGGGVRGTYRVAYNNSNALRSATTTRFVYLGRYTCD